MELNGETDKFTITIRWVNAPLSKIDNQLNKEIKKDKEENPIKE